MSRPGGGRRLARRSDERAGPMSVLERILRRDAEPTGDVVVEPNAPTRSPQGRDGRSSRPPTRVRGRTACSSARSNRLAGRHVGTTWSPAAARDDRRVRRACGSAPVRRTSPTSPSSSRMAASRALPAKLLVELGTKRPAGDECAAWTLEVRVSSTGAQELYRTFGFAPAGVRQAVLREHRGRHRDVVPRHRRR